MEEKDTRQHVRKEMMESLVERHEPFLREYEILQKFCLIWSSLVALTLLEIWD